MLENYIQIVKSYDEGTLKYFAEHTCEIDLLSNIDDLQRAVIDKMEEKWETLSQEDKDREVVEDLELQEGIQSLGAYDDIIELYDESLIAEQASDLGETLSLVLNRAVTSRTSVIIPKNVSLDNKKVGWGPLKLKLLRVELDQSIGPVKLVSNGALNMKVYVPFSAHAKLIYKKKRLFNGYGSENDKNFRFKGVVEFECGFNEDGVDIKPTVAGKVKLTQASFHLGVRISVRGLLGKAINKEVDKYEPMISDLLNNVINNKVEGLLVSSISEVQEAEPA
jgi:hypothetical protein